MVKGPRGTLSLLFLALFDLLLLNQGLVFSYWFQYDLEFSIQNIKNYSNLIQEISLISLVVFYFFDLYTDWRRKSIRNLVLSIILAIITVTAFTLSYTFWVQVNPVPRKIILIASVIQIVLITLSRSSIWIISKMLFGRSRVLIIGEDLTECLTVAEKVLQHANGWFVVQDIMQSSQKNDLFEKLQSVDTVLLSPNIPDKSEIIRSCTTHGKEVLLVPKLFDLFVMGADPQQIDDMLVLSVKPPKLCITQLFVKRVLDVIVSFCLLLIFSPFMVLSYALIPLASPGAAVYKQERVGIKGRKFNLYKFRSMVQDAEMKTGPVLAASHDPRITLVGRFIRATRLDELPQLFNVLKGDMSLVGPRPERTFFIEQFKGIFPDYEYRFLIKPGITGLAQVMSKYSTTVEYKLHLDLMYINHYSLWLDLKILLQTIRVVLQKEQAEGIKVTNQFQSEKLQGLFQHSETFSTPK